MAEPGPESEGGAGAESEPGVLRTLLVGLAVCGVCAAVLSTTIVVLRPLQLENQRRDREARVEELVAGLPGMRDLVLGAGAVDLDVRAVDLATGDYAPAVDAEALVRSDGAQADGTPLAPERDLAGIGERPLYAPVYLLERDGELQSVILPVYGRGFLSLMRGYLALAPDGNTVRGLTFTEHQETPGLGAEIENPEWQARWHGKRLHDESGAIRIQVVQAPVDPGSVHHEVHGISGATRTGDGVTAMVRFWVGPDGFGPFLDRIGQERGS